MEHSLSAYTYKGSIPRAILESKSQKKLFVVYISGSDDQSVELEKSTWTDSKVAETLSKYCILLHLLEGSTDATHLSAIYPYKSVPSIIAIGYNGVQLWQSEGLVSADVLASSLENAWLSLHVQETTAAVLSAALASKKPELSTAGPSDPGLSEKESFSDTVMQSPSTDNHVESPDASLPTASESETINEPNIKEWGKGTKDVDKRCSEVSNADKSRNNGAEKPASLTEEADVFHSPMTVDQNNSLSHDMSSSIGNGRSTPTSTVNYHPGGSDLDATKTNEVEDEGKADIVDDTKRVDVHSDVHLNIRLPNGVSLQEKFFVTSTLRTVKDYVDRNQACEVGSYDLAIPYPRKVFSNDDLSKSLSELGLFNRQALIVVPHQRSTNYHRGQSSSGHSTSTSSDPSIASNGGYFGYLRSMLSYINPLSYIGGNSSSSSSGRPQTGMWEYNPNPALRNNLPSIEGPYHSNLPNQGSSATGRNDPKRRQPVTSRIGSNIHTLKHDEDDGRFGDRNSFWNGNSTQYGGNSDDK